MFPKCKHIGPRLKAPPEKWTKSYLFVCFLFNWSIDQWMTPPEKWKHFLASHASHDLKLLFVFDCFFWRWWQLWFLWWWWQWWELVQILQQSLPDDIACTECLMLQAVQAVPCLTIIFWWRRWYGWFKKQGKQRTGRYAVCVFGGRGCGKQYMSRTFL